ncbi:MAG: 3-deoxy-manno-octulosonate cytidylyltransferase [Bacteriovoracaceae bacterium]|nr:3-deoxy-manno-octulosonate cytidylyltransferase [Bacteriovoracaceae bacterium]
MHPHVLVLVPARYGSTRLPAKPLAKIGNNSMVGHMVKNLMHPELETVIVTDHLDIESEVKRNGGKSVRVDDDVMTGTERIALAYERHFKPLKKWDLIINAQGDEPLMKSSLILSLAEFHLKTSFDVATAVVPRQQDLEEYHSPQTVKVAFTPTSGECHYFSRSPIPFYRDPQAAIQWYQHLGLYSYRPEVLLNFAKLPTSWLEKSESLEQLRILEAKKTIGAVTTQDRLISVDVKDDIARVENALKK